MKQIMGINTQTFRYVCNECGCIFVSDEGMYRPAKIGNYDIYEDVCMRMSVRVAERKRRRFRNERAKE